MGIVCGIEWGACSRPNGAFIGLDRVSEEANWFGKRFGREERFVALRRGRNKPECFVAAHWHFAELLAAESKAEDPMSHVFPVGDKDAVRNDRPIAHESVALRNNVDPFLWPIRLDANFDDATVWSFTIRHRQNLAVSQAQRQAVIDSGKDQFGRGGVVE